MHNRALLSRALAVWLGLSIGPLAIGGTLPLWEIGAGGGGLRIPDYRGADEFQSFVFPIIYPVYRGRILRVDDEGVRGFLFKSDRLKFDISLDAAIPVDSDDNDAREGMPDLDATVQFGPSLEIKLWDAPLSLQRVSLNLPLRGVFAVDASSVDGIGLTFSPNIKYNRTVTILDRQWKLRLSGGLEFGSNRFHDYYYEVKPEFVTPVRPAFDPDAGFGGTRFIFTFNGRHPKGKNWISVFARYDQIDGATFEDSPLVRRSSGFTVGFIYAHYLFHSKKSVAVED
ncbi:MAG: MipA/OmpV family protein [Gammaproteobacteria bacterium]|nr:MipA/OmpV family protein [Gammaproteobacteria bacterium]